MDTSSVNRVEIIDGRACKRCAGKGYIDGNECTACYGMGNTGRTVILGGPAYKKPEDTSVALSFQDDGRTLKIFLEDKVNENA